MKRKGKGRLLSCLMILLVVLNQLLCLPVGAAETQPQTQIVMTLGADLTAEQKAYVLQYFGVAETQVKVITITNADEKSQLGNLISAEKIGTHTLSCALVRLTGAGGIQVKTANMNYVTSNMIASTLSTSGVYNCEVLTAAPFEVSGTGALTGVMMAYETASGAVLDAEKKALANEELVITGEIADTVGQDQATLVVNDIKIHIVRDQITDQQEVNSVVDEVIATTEQAAQEAAAAQGKEAPAVLGQVEHEKLYNFGYKFSQMGYKYKDMQQTLERVTHNVTKSTGIDDPITDTFTTIGEDSSLSIDSILLNTDDAVLGENAIINATNNVALGEHPAEPIDVFTGDPKLTEAGGIKAKRFISNSNVIAYKDVNGSYSLIDLNGNILTDAVYADNFKGDFGHIKAVLDGENGLHGLLSSDGSVAVPFQYSVVEVIGDKWAMGITLKPGTEEDYDYSVNGNRCQIDRADVYYLGNESQTPVGALSREQLAGTEAFGDYLNIKDYNGVVTTYDSAFTPVQTAESLSNFGAYDEDRMLIDALAKASGYDVYRFRGGYAKAGDWEQGKYGVMDRYGNIIVPVQFDAIGTSYQNLHMSGGYFSAKIGDNFAYVTAGGNVTGQFNYPYDEVINYGISARYKAPDGSIVLLSGDGKETNLGTGYLYVDEIRESKGMFWKGDTGSGYDLIDWHGNVLLTGSDDYSMSANGNYLIAQNGYTSSTLYMVNDASEAKITESLGGASELELTVEEGASMEAYTKDPEVELIGDVFGTRFVDGTDLITASNDGEKYALMDVSGKQLTNPEYSRYFENSKGWLISESESEEGSRYGLISADGVEILPCEYDVVKVLDENWIAAYTLLKNGTEEDYDFKNYDGEYFQIEEAVIYHVSPEELTSVTLTRDQIAEAAAEDEYLNIRDRSTGAVTTYDSSFTAVASVNYVDDFKNFSASEVLFKKLSDSTGLSISSPNFQNGYAKASDYSQNPPLTGIIDMNGNLVVPIEYHGIQPNYNLLHSPLWANGYFAVEKDGMAGYVTKDNTVTCELKYPKDSFYNGGMAARFDNGDGTYTLVAADGTETPGLEYLTGFGRGKFWEVCTNGKYSLIDWHGNVIFDDYYEVDVSDDDKFIIVQMSYNEMPQLYAVDGATVEEVTGNSPKTAQAEPETDEASEEKPAAEDEKTPADTDSGLAAGLLDSALSLISTDLDANTDSILVLLNQAKTALDTENPDAAMVLNSAITLLESGAPDADSITTLIETTKGML